MARRKPKKIEENTELFGDERFKALESTLTDLTKRYGDGAIVRLGEATHMDVATIPTGSLTTDIALGVGGVPRGRILEIYGPESSGKTTFCLHVIREAQIRGGLCAFVDMEHALDPTYAARIGVDIEQLYVSQPDTGEQALEITEALVRSGALDVVVVDSVAALVPRAEIEGEMGDSHVGLQARLMSQALRKLSGAIKQSNVSVIFTNQLREKVGVMFGCFHGDNRVQLANGRTESIRNIVDNRMNVEVMSYNTLTQQFEPKRIVNWFNNGKAEKFLKFTVAAVDGGTHTFECTPNHELLTEHGYEAAENLRVGERLVTMAGVLELSITAGMLPQAPFYQPAPMEILAIDAVEDFNDMTRYDIEVDGNHCYVVDGVVVHNSPETTSGGRALKFYASVRLDIRRIQSIKQGGEVVGNRTRIKVKKNKVAPPFRESEFDIMFYENGISKPGEIVDLGTDIGIIEKRGAFYRYNDELLGQGRENTKVHLTENPEISNELENKIREHFGLPNLDGVPNGIGPEPTGLSSNGDDDSGSDDD
ncbi:MAG: recombinase RecA [Chloroflexota bacterium]